jgi:hypothetical protein
MRILKSLGSVLLGFIVASLVMMIVESINGHVLYPALGKAAQGVTDQEVVRRIMATAPKGALLVVIFGWALGSLVGGWVAGKLAPGSPRAHGMALAALLTLAGLANNLMIPPPLWFWIASLAVMAPSTFFGVRLAAPEAAAS